MKAKEEEVWLSSHKDWPYFAQDTHQLSEIDMTSLEQESKHILDTYRQTVSMSGITCRQLCIGIYISPTLNMSSWLSVFILQHLLGPFVERNLTRLKFFSLASMQRAISWETCDFRCPCRKDCVLHAVYWKWRETSFFIHHEAQKTLGVFPRHMIHLEAGEKSRSLDNPWNSILLEIHPHAA